MAKTNNKRREKEIKDIYDSTLDLLSTLTTLNSRWLRTRDLINEYNYTDLDLFKKHSKTMDNLFSAEQQIRQMYNHYGNQLKLTKDLEEEL